MKTLLVGTTILLGCLVATAAWADPPSFNYVQVQAQHANTSGDSNWGWGARASFNPAGNWFVSGRYLRANYVNYAQSDLRRYRLNVGYKKDLLDTLAVYGTAGWSAMQVAGSHRNGAVAGVGVRANVLSIVQLRVSGSHHFVDAGFDAYSAGALIHIFPFSWFSVGMTKYSGSGPLSDSTLWHTGLRFSF